jgi:hypothetical protein
MGVEDYIRDISYLLSGTLSDLTLSFGDKTWRIHKALTVCHSKWFQKALTSGLEVGEHNRNQGEDLTSSIGIRERNHHPTR